MTNVTSGCVVTPGHRLSISRFGTLWMRSQLCIESKSGWNVKKKNRLRMPSLTIHV